MNQTGTNANTLASVQEIVAALSSLGLPVPEQGALQGIQRNCREVFLGHLSACIVGSDTDGSRRSALESLLGCLSSETCEAIHALGLVPTYNALATIGNHRPKRFLSALNIARQADNPKREEALAFLREVLVARPASQPEMGSAAPQSSSSASPSAVPSCHVSQTPSLPDAAPQPPLRLASNALAENTSASAPAPAETGTGEEKRKFDSQHVYGSGYALCFNTGNWNGNHGVMVDAATALGPKDYDWKNAIHVWLDAREVAACLSVFRKRRPSVEFNAHGAQNDKSFALAFQGAHYYAKVSAKNKGVRAVKILPTDATAVSVLFLRQLGRAYPDIPLETLLDLALTVNELPQGLSQAAA